jgi:hypothetical protein
MYFLRRLRPLEIAGERVRSLRASLNAPVISAPDLPAGPARAVIVVHREARGGMDATVGVRSVVTGEIAYWSFDGELASDADLSVAADAALTFAESLGFLFDDGAGLSGAAAEKAFRAWRAPSQPAPAGVESARDPDDSTDALFEDGPVLELDDLAHGAAQSPPGPPAETPASTTQKLDGPGHAPVLADAPPAQAPKADSAAGATTVPIADAATDAPKPSLVVGSARAAQRTLSKFRVRDAPPSGADNSAEAASPKPALRKLPLRQPLARVALVKRRSPEDERKLAIRKLLTSF